VTVSIVGGLLTAGCQPSTSQQAPTINAGGVASYSGVPLRTSDFAVLAPTGWTDQTFNQTDVAALGATGRVLLLLEAPPPGHFQPGVNDIQSNINAVREDVTIPSDQLVQYLQTASHGGGTSPSAPQSVDVNGEQGVSITFNRSVNGTPAKTQDIVVDHYGHTYDITLNTSAFAFTQQFPALVQVVATWQWST